jgi:ribosomal-protein-alanine N-acetyltransferase
LKTPAVDGDGAPEPIRTARLDLVPISTAFAQALVDGDRHRASTIIGAAVGGWLGGDPSHVVQLAMAQAAAGTPEGGGRVIVLVGQAGRRRAIGSIGFHGPPDDRGRIEVGSRINPAHRGRGYAGEAMTAMFEFAATKLGITRFLVAVSSPDALAPRLMTELELTGRGPSGDQVAELDAVLDAAPSRHEVSTTSVQPGTTFGSV